jgi:hypothetical protein
VAESATGVAVDIQPFIFEENPQGLTIISFEGESWFERDFSFYFHEYPEVAFESGSCSTDVFNWKKVSQTFSNRDSSFGGHVDEREAMDLDPEMSFVERKFS